MIHKDILVGDILVLKSHLADFGFTNCLGNLGYLGSPMDHPYWGEEELPADLVPLACSGVAGQCYVSTVPQMQQNAGGSVTFIEWLRVLGVYVNRC